MARRFHFEGKAPLSRSMSTDESDTTTRRDTRHPASAGEGRTPRM